MSRHLSRWPHWPWSAWALECPDFVQGVRSLLRQTQGLPVAGWETSVRLTPAGVSRDRLLVGIGLGGVAAARLEALVDALQMPPAFQDEFRPALHQVTQIMLAIERQGRAVEHRAYQTLHPDSALASAGLAMRGFKWLPASAEDAVCRVTDYWRVPVQTAQLDELLLTCPGVPASARPAYGVLHAALRLALQRQPGWRAHDFLVASEWGAARASCCMRLYESGLLGSDLASGIDELLAHWGWTPQARAAALLPLAPRPVGWLAAGIDRHEQAFLTVYCEGERDDARLALLNGNLHATA